MAPNKMNQIYSLLGKDYRLLKFIFIILASCLIIDLFYTFWVLKPTYTSNEKRRLSAEDFPEIILCPEPSIYTDAVESRGYADQAAYFMGMNTSDLTQIGWVGNRSEDVEKVSQEVSVLKSIKDCPSGDESYISYGGKAKSLASIIDFVEFNLTKALTPYHRCCRVIPPERSRTYPVFTIQFGWPAAVDNEGSFKVFMADRLTASFFDLHKAVMLGDKIVSGTDSHKMNNGLMNYKVKIIEDAKLEGDPKYPCIDYNIHGEYAKCVEEDNVRQSMKYLNCTPPWMTDDEDVWCRGAYKADTDSTLVELIFFFERLSISEGNLKKCSVPCKIKRYQAKEIGLRGKKNFRGIMLSFEQEVEVTKSSWNIDARTLLSKIGGFIGISKNFLWLILLLMSSITVLISHFKI